CSYFMRGLAALVILLSSVCAHAAQFAGTVRAADQLIPGATVTARAGESKIVTYTDENGRYTLDLKPGAWEVEIVMFGFDPQRAQVTIAEGPVTRDWIIEMPRGPAGQTSSSARESPAPAPVRNRPQFGRGGGGRGGFGRGGGRGSQQPGQQPNQQPAF